MTFKIVFYIKVFYQTDIIKMVSVWVIDDLYDIYLQDIYNLRK